MKPLNRAPESYNRTDEQQVRVEIETTLRNLSRPTARYLVSGFAEADIRRSLSAAATHDDVVKVLSTLIKDLTQKGVLG